MILPFRWGKLAQQSVVRAQQIPDSSVGQFAAESGQEVPVSLFNSQYSVCLPGVNRHLRDFLR